MSSLYPNYRFVTNKSASIFKITKQAFINICISGFILLSACTHVETYDDIRQIEKAHPYVASENKLPDIVNDLPDNASHDVLYAQLNPIMNNIAKVTRQDIHILRDATGRLRKQPHIITALKKYYDELDKKQFNRRVLVLGVMGELQRTDAFDFYKNQIWKPLPAKKKTPESYYNWLYEVAVQMNTVNSLAYIRGSNNNLHTPSMSELISIMKDHPEHMIRVQAIDAYLWNRNDSKEAKDKLARILPKSMHTYIGRPRIHAGKNKEQFLAEIRQRQNK